jgi:isoquinoline 1-oxidoreductase beta subunit
MRQVGAGARQMLETAAAKRWNVPVGEVKASLHEVVHTPSGKKLGYGELAADAAALPAPALDTLKLKEPSAFRYIGKGNVQIVDLFDITTGNTTYGQDVKLPGLKYAVIARTPVVGGKVASFDAAATMKVPGVLKVVTIDGTPAPAAFAPKAGVAVIANNTWAALKGRDLSRSSGTTDRTARSIRSPTRRCLRKTCASQARSSATRVTWTRHSAQPRR